MKIKLTNLTNRFDISHIDNKKWELILTEILLESIEKITETIMVKETCWRICKELCGRNNIRADFNNCAKQCTLIKNMLYLYECVNQRRTLMEEEYKIWSEKVRIFLTGIMMFQQ